MAKDRPQDHPVTRAIDRRTVGLALGVAAAAVATAGPAWSQTTVAPEWQTLLALTREALAAGIAAPQVAPPASGAASYRDIAPAILDFIDKVDDVLEVPGHPRIAIAKDLVRRAEELLGKVGRRERSGRQKSDAAPGALFGFAGFVASAQAQTPPPDARFRRYHDGYLQLFDSCLVRDSHKSDVKTIVDRILSDRYRPRYAEVETAVCVPWWFIAVIHSLEADSNFGGHLHNGDPLGRKTVNEPPNRPPNWNPPGTWLDSAKDALAYDKFVSIEDWSLAASLYRWEIYNGVRSRELHGINTPYLWSFSNHYAKGKFTSDGDWDDQAVSQQCGAAVILHELVQRGVVRFG